MRSGDIKLDLEASSEVIFRRLAWVCFYGYWFYSMKTISVLPGDEIQAGIVVLGIISLFCYWFFEEYYLAEAGSKRIWKCKGNRFFVDKIPFLEEKDIYAFAIDFQPSKSIWFCLSVITPGGERIRISDFEKLPAYLKGPGEKLSKLFDKKFYYAESTGGLVVDRNSSGSLTIYHKDSYAIIREVKWGQIALVMIPVLVIFAYLMNWASSIANR